MRQNQLRQWGISLGFAILGWVAWGLASSTAFGQPAATDAKPATPARHVFVPLEDLDVIFDKTAQGVILPRKLHDEYQALAEKAKLKRPPGDVGLILSSGEYKGRIEGEQLLLSARWELTQFDDDWQVLTLPLRNLAVESAKLDDKPAQLARVSPRGTQLALYSKGAGKHVLQLELAAPLVSVGGDKVTGIGLPLIPAATLSLPVAAGKSLHVNYVAPERSAPLDKPADYKVAIGGVKVLALRISDKHAEHSSDSLVFAQTAISVHAAAEEVTWQANASLQIFGRGVDLLEFLVPKALEIVSVESTGLERWEIADGPDAQTRLLKLTYRQTVEEARSVQFRGLVAASLGQPWSVPTLTLRQATSQVARITVEHAHGLRLQLVEQTGVRRIEDDANAPRPAANAAKGGEVARADRWTFSAWKPDFALLFITQPKARELQTTISTLLDINSRMLSLTSLITVQSRFAPLFELELTLPAEWTITDIKATDPQQGGQVANAAKKSIPWRVVPLEAGKHQVRISFDPPIPTNGTVQLTVTAEMTPGENWPIETAPLLLKLPEVTLPQAAVTDGTFLIAVEDDLEVLPEEVTGLDPAKVPAAAAGTVGPKLAYQYQDTRFSGRLKVTRKPQRIAVRNLGLYRLDRQTLVSHIESAIAVEGGGVRKLEIAVSESAGDDLQFEVIRGKVQIVEQKPAAPANGERLWTLLLDQRVRGAFVLGVDITKPRGDAKEFTLPTVRIQGADRQDSYVALEGGPDQQLTVKGFDAGDKPLIETPSDAVPVPLDYQPQERIVAAFHTVLPGYKVTATETRFDRLGVPSALCDEQQIISVIGASGEIQHQATFTLRLSGVQSLLANLPEGAILWSTLLDGTPIEVRRGEDKERGGHVEYQVPLPRLESPGGTRRLQLFYQTSDSELKSAGWLEQQPPRLRLLTGTGATQPLEVLSRQWRVYYPGDVRLTSSSGAFEPVTQIPRYSLLRNLEFRWQHSTEEWWERGIAVAIVIASLGALTLAFRRRRWVGLISVAAALFVAGIFGLGGLAVQSGKDLAEMKSKKVTSTGRIHGIDDSGSMGGETRPPRRDYDSNVHPKEEHVGSGETLASAPDAKPTSEAPRGEAAEGDPKADFGAPPPRDLTLQKDYPKYGVVNGMLPNGQLKAPRQKPGDQPMVDLAQPGAMQVGPPAKQPAPAALAPQGGGAEVAQAGPAANQPAEPPGAQAGEAQNPPLPGMIPAFRMASDTGSATTGKGRLSLSLQVSPAAGDGYFDFTYNGQAGAEEPKLGVTYLRRQRADLWTIGVMLGLLWISFWLRNRTLGSKVALAICGWVVPIALTPVVSASVLPFLDGLFLGTTAAVALWCVLGIFGWCARHCCQTATSAVTTALLLCALTGLPHSNARADEAPAAGPVAEVHRLPTVILPYDSSKDLKDAERVFLPLDKFRELWNQAHPEERIGSKAPVDGLISEALYSAKYIPGDGKLKARVEITARLAVHSFRTEQVPLPLPIGPVALDLALLDGKAAPLQTINAANVPAPSGKAYNSKPVPQQAVLNNPAMPLAGHDEQPGIAILLTTPGLHIVDLRFSLPVDQRGPAGSFVLPVKPVATGQLQFPLPANDLTLQVNGGGVFRQVTQDGKQTALIPVDAGGNITVSWAPKQAQETANGIVHVTSRTAVRLDDTGIRLQSTFDYVVRQGTLANVQFSLPEGLLVRQIASLDLAGWEVNGTGAQRTLKVFLRRPVTDKTRLAFDLYFSQKFTEETQTITLPDFGPQGATRETGLIGLFAESHLTMSAGTLKGLTQIEPQQFAPPEAVQSRRAATPAPIVGAGVPQLAYRYAARPIELQLLVARQKPRSQGESSHVVLLSPRKIRQNSWLQWNLVGAPRSEVAVQLPPGYLLYDLHGAGIADYFVESRGAAPGAATEPSTLHVILERPRTGKLHLFLEGIISRNPDELTLQLAVPTPLGAQELRTNVGLWLDTLFTGNLQELNGWKSIDPAQLPAWTTRNRQPAQFAFSSNTPELQPIGITLAKATPRLQAAAVTIVSYRETSLNYLLQLQWQIDLAGETEFIFTTPDWLADRLDFSGNDTAVRLRQVISEKADAGRLRWIVSLEEPRRHSLFLTARATLPPPQNGRVVVPRIVFEQRGAKPAPAGEAGAAAPAAPAAGKYQPLERQREYALLINASPAPLDPLNAKGVESLAATDLPIRLGSRLTDQATEILRITQPATAEIGWQIRTREAVKSLPATVNLANLKLVLDRDGSWRCQVDYRINNRERQFLAVELPANSRILSLFVAKRPARPVRKPGSSAAVYLIPLPKTAAGELAAEVRMVIAGRLADGLPDFSRLQRKEIDLPAPRVLGENEDADFGMPVAATEWTVFFPKGFDVKPVDEPERTNVTTTAEGFGQAMADFQELTQLWNAMAKRGSEFGSSSYESRVEKRALYNSKQVLDKASGMRGTIYEKLNEEQRQQFDQQLKLAEDNQRKLTEDNRQRLEKESKKQSMSLGKKLQSLDEVQQEQIVANATEVGSDGASKPGSAVLAETGIEGREENFWSQLEEGEKTHFVDSMTAEGETTGRAGKPGGGKSSELNSRARLKSQNLEQSKELTGDYNQLRSTHGGGSFGKGGGLGGGGSPFGNFGGRGTSGERNNLLSRTDRQSGANRRGPAAPAARPSPARDEIKMFDNPVNDEVAQGQRVEVGEVVDAILGANVEGPGEAQVGGAQRTMMTGAFGDAASLTGLSLPLELPDRGEKLTFFKAGGDAKLAVGVRSGQTWEAGGGVLWAVIWIVIGGALALGFARHARFGVLVELLARAGIALGLIWFFLLPNPWLGFLIFVASATVFALRRVSGASVRS